MYKLGIAILILTAFACGRSEQSTGTHDHEAELAEGSAIQSTLFSENTEFFIEYDPLVIGKESGFLVHVTDLESYDPYTSGSLSIEIGGQTSFSEAPERPGIFHIPFQPEVPGEFTITYTLKAGEFTDRVSAHVEIEEGDHDEAHEHEHAEQTEAVAHEHEEGSEPVGEIVFLKEQAWKSDFMVEELQHSSFSSIISASGEILAVPGEKKHIAARSSGVLLFLEKNLVQGTRVEKGQTLFIISAATVNEDNFELRFQELENSLEKSRSEYLRHKILYAEKVVSEKKFIESKTAYASDSIRYYNLASKVSAEGMKVLSPISGYIHELNFSEGQYVELGQQIVTISSNKYLLLRADVPMQHYSLLGDIVTANFRTAYSDKTYSMEELHGKLLAKGSSVAENDHYIPVFFELENDGTLLEGAFVEFFLKSREKESALIVPVSAVTEEQGMHYVYVQVSGESFSKKAVKPGENDGNNIEIISGLSSGDRYVSEGVMLLKAASMVTGGASQGHNH